jgi:putative endonuclease
MNATKNLGETGEEMAAKFLEKHGFTILHRNWRTRKLEVDIVALHGKYLVFVEVKTRSGTFYGEAVDAVTRKKQKQIIKAANDYYSQYKREEESRFDIIGIWHQPGIEPEIRHLADAFYPLAG